MWVGQDVSLYGQLDDVSSLLALYLPLSQGAQEVAVENGSALGKDMYVPGRQQPTRAVLDPRSLNALFVPARDCHAPPHNVRLKPLL